MSHGAILKFIRGADYTYDNDGHQRTEVFAGPGPYFASTLARDCPELLTSGIIMTALVWHCIRSGTVCNLLGSPRCVECGATVVYSLDHLMQRLRCLHQGCQELPVTRVSMSKRVQCTNATLQKSIKTLAQDQTTLHTLPSVQQLPATFDQLEQASRAGAIICKPQGSMAGDESVNEQTHYEDLEQLLVVTERAWRRAMRQGSPHKPGSPEHKMRQEHHRCMMSFLPASETPDNADSVQSTGTQRSATQRPSVRAREPQEACAKRAEPRLKRELPSLAHVITRLE